MAQNRLAILGHIECLGKKGNLESSVQEASYNTERATELISWNRRTCVYLNNIISYSQNQPPQEESGQKEATSEYGHLRNSENF